QFAALHMSPCGSMQDLELEPEGASRRLQVSRLCLGGRLPELTRRRRSARRGDVIRAPEPGAVSAAPEMLTAMCCNPTRRGSVPVHAAVFPHQCRTPQNPYSMFRFPVSLKKFPVPLHWEFCR